MKIALLQLAFENNKNSMNEKVVSKIEEASKNGAKLVVLQELHQNEYFCINEDEKFFDYAKDFENDVKFWSQIAKKFHVVLVTSLFEKRTQGLYHNTAVIFDQDGSVAGKYRKMHIPEDPGFFEKFYFTPGDLGFKPIQTSIGKLGVLICWDQWYPEAARCMALNGADILIYPTAIGWFDSDSTEEKTRQKDAWTLIQRSHAVANGLHVVSVNRVGYEKDSTKLIDGIRFWGGSFVSGPQGEIITKADENECILYANIDIKASDSVRRMWPFLRDRRIENYGDLLKRYCD